MTRVLLLGAMMLCGAALPLDAQLRPDLVPGARVQFHLPGSGQTERVTAELVSVGRESFRFRLDGSELAYRSSAAPREARFDQVGFMRVSRGHSRAHSAWRGALWGAYVLGGAGAVTGPLAARSLDMGSGQAAAVIGAGSGLVGAGIGAVIGAIVSPERWKSYRFVGAR